MPRWALVVAWVVGARAGNAVAGCAADFDAVHSFVLYDEAPALSVGDVDGDALPDALVSDGGEARLLRAVPGGWYEPRPPITSNALVTAVELGDVDGDGALDLVLFDSNLVGLGVYLGDGAGGFTHTWPLARAPGGWCDIVAIRIADVDRDGNANLVCARGGCGVDVYLGNGNGTFRGTGVVDATGIDLQVADMDADGILDLVSIGSRDVMVSIGDGSGWFRYDASYPSGQYSNGIALGDLDGDGAVDVATANTGTGDVGVLLGNGDGTLRPVTLYPLAGAHGIDVADIDGDGDLDLVVVTEQYPVLACILPGNGDGTFGTATCNRLAGARSSVQVADADGDGDPDVLAAGDGSLALLLDRGDGTFPEAALVTVGRRPADVSVMDVDGDGHEDLLTADSTDATLSFLAGRGDGTFGAKVASPIGSAPIALAVADVDGDGARDAAVLGREVTILKGSGTGTFQPIATYASGLVPRFLAAADLDGSGTPDLVVSDAGSSTLRILLGAIDGTFVPAAPVPVGDTPNRPCVADVDRDGKADLVVADEGSHDVRVELGNGDGTFHAGGAFPAGLRPHGVVAADLSGDGVVDLAVAGSTDREVSVLLGTGHGTFWPRESYPARHAPDVISAADVDGDGDLDLLVTSFAGSLPAGKSNVTLLVNDGRGLFRSLGGLLVGETPAAIAIADLDRDGVLDIAAADEFRNRVAIAFGAGLGMSPPDLPPGVLGSAYAALLTAAGGAPPYTFVLAGGMLPPGLALAGSGQLAGTPAAPGVFDFQVRVADAASCARQRSYRIVVAAAGCAGLVLGPPRLPQGFAGSPYAMSLTTSGGTAPLRYSIVGGAMPPGLVLDPSGLISGTPASAGTFAFEAGVVDGAGCIASRRYLVRIVACAAIAIAPAQLPHGVEGAPYSVTLTPSGGRAPYAFALASGSLPGGISLAPGSGVLSGAPTATGTSSFIIRATDSLGCVAARGYDLIVEPRRSYVLGQGFGLPDPNRVRLFRGDGVPTAVDFMAYAAGTWGATVAAGQLDAGIHDAILTGPGPGPVHGPHVRGFRRDGGAMGSVNFYAYGTLRSGVGPAAGDIDGDGFAEIVTGPGPGPSFGPHVRAFDVDGGAVAPLPRVSFFAYATLRYGVNVVAADLERDGYDELVTGPGPGPSFAPVVRGFDYDGVAVVPLAKIAFAAYAALDHGVVVAAADVDVDGYAEMATAPGPGPSNPARFEGFDYDGIAVAALPGYDATPFTTLHGGRLGLGDVTGALRWDLLAGAGPDVSSSTDVAAFAYDGAALRSIASAPAAPFPGGYGVNPGAGTLGW